MFDTLLIANRGEIACRVMETAQAMGIHCVAVYSDADANARHVDMADSAVHIGGNAPADSYLRGDAIIQAALDTGAQAIHPGYGFLSENPDFVDAVTEAGLAFVGPSAEAIRAMGLKDAAKALMATAGVPIVPGYHGDNQDAAFLHEQADSIGYPVLIKAVAGGGGKGMRLVDDSADFSAALDSARSEAQTAFGNPDVLIEKYVTQPRHIEVQVFGDGPRAVHLFERDCSLQRRHQKVIEEAPAPGMTDEMRKAMGDAAVRAAESIGYSGAGTVEFIVDSSDGLRADRFYFMEMNTRLQVEHPVTEAITGVDLVALQLRVASGESLPLRQEDLQITGHSFEARLYAEDVPKGFLPATGRLTALNFPDGVRADTGVRAGDEISPWYDPMIAKLTVHGDTREIALKKLEQALSNTQVAGTTTNLAFLGALAAHDGFGRGEVDTGLIARDLDALIDAPGWAPLHAVAAGQAATGLAHYAPEAGFALWSPLSRSVPLRVGEEDLDLSVRVVSPNQQNWLLGDTEVTLHRDGTKWRAQGKALPFVHIAGADITVMDNYGLSFRSLDPLDRATEMAGQGGYIEAPMPGLVKAIFAAPGQAVSKGDKLVILEAMKMEHTLTAVRDGILAEVLTAAGDQVSAGDVLVRLEDEDVE